MLNRRAAARPSAAVQVLRGRPITGQTDGQTPDRGCIARTAIDAVSVINSRSTETIDRYCWSFICRVTLDFYGDLSIINSLDALCVVYFMQII